jgi:hypothetical protein
VLALDVPSLGVPLGPSVRERETLQLVVRPETQVIHITLLEGERQSFVSDTMWLLPVAVPMAADTAIALPQLLALCRTRLGAQAGTAQRLESRRARAAAMHDAARKHSQAWIEQNWHHSPSRRRASTVNSTHVSGGSPGPWCMRTGGAGAKCLR